MVTKSKLKMALAAEKGVDFKKLHLKKKEKAARKGKAKKNGGEAQPLNGKKVEEEWEDVEEEDEDEGSELDGEDSGSEVEVDGPMKVCYIVCIYFLL
jgi:rRNA-processing protein EBP2